MLECRRKASPRICPQNLTLAYFRFLCEDEAAFVDAAGGPPRLKKRPFLAESRHSPFENHARP
jgi:hypothetical protein